MNKCELYRYPLNSHPGLAECKGTRLPRFAIVKCMKWVLKCSVEQFVFFAFVFLIIPGNKTKQINSINLNNALHHVYLANIRLSSIDIFSFKLSCWSPTIAKQHPAGFYQSIQWLLDCKGLLHFVPSPRAVWSRRFQSQHQFIAASRLRAINSSSSELGSLWDRRYVQLHWYSFGTFSSEDHAISEFTLSVICSLLQSNLLLALYILRWMETVAQPCFQCHSKGGWVGLLRK